MCANILNGCDDSQPDALDPQDRARSAERTERYLWRDYDWCLDKMDRLAKREQEVMEYLPTRKEMKERGVDTQVTDKHFQAIIAEHDEAARYLRGRIQAFKFDQPM